MCDIFTNIFRLIPQGYPRVNLCCNCITCRLLFFSTFHTSGIYKASLDGTKVTSIVSGLSKGTGLDIDSTGRICWADYSKYHVIASVKLTTCRRCLGVTGEMLKLISLAGLDRSVCPSVHSQ